MCRTTIVEETLELLWQNHLILVENVSPEAMSPSNLAAHSANSAPARPFRIATWLSRQGFFISAWALWERYARDLCMSMSSQCKRSNSDSHVVWVRQCMSQNGVPFTHSDWFQAANYLRNLIAHSGAYIDSPTSQRQLERALVAFPDLRTYADGYLAIEHDHVAELQLKIEEFVDESAQHHSGRHKKEGR
jgi:hypothetical protein